MKSKRTYSLKENIRFVPKCSACSGFEDKIKPYANIGFHGNAEESQEIVSDFLERKEICESQKHEVIMSIADRLDMGPEGISKAEKIFDELRYAITNFVVHYEFNESVPLSTQLALWLDMKMMPRQKKRMELVFNHFFRRSK